MIWPHLIRIAWPAYTNEVVFLFHATALVYFTLPVIDDQKDLMNKAGELFERDYNAFLHFSVAALYFLAISLLHFLRLRPHLPPSDATHAAGAAHAIRVRAGYGERAMAFERKTVPLRGDTPGADAPSSPTTRSARRDAPEKVHLQAALHADEQPGTMVLHHLLPMLRHADDAGPAHAPGSP